MFCSIIIPTVGRTSLSHSVKSVLEQNFSSDAFEIIVVNDSGQPLPFANWQESNQVQMIETQRRERCFARNTGAAIAKGDYFCFLDDDDWLLPEALNHFWALAQQFPETAWLYGGVAFVDNEGKTLGFLNQGKTGNCFVEAMTEIWIPIQGSLIKANAFFQVGGFNPEFVVTQDLDLLRRIALIHNLANTAENVACIQRGNVRSTETKYSIGWYYIAKGRDSLLAHPNTLHRLVDSAKDTADGSAYLHGLILRNYLKATLFNLRRYHWLNAASRFFAGIQGCLLSFKYIVTKDYWQAIKDNRPLHLSHIRDASPDYDSVEEWLY